MVVRPLCELYPLLMQVSPMVDARRCPELVVLVPTYHEVDNLPELARRVFSALSTAGIEAELFIIDDDS